jgi:2-oxoglutarate dehydrogenase E1 component
MVHLAMAYNPSHLEIVDPVVEGSVRAKQWRRGDEARQEVLPVLLHGDAAFSSQGVIQETFNMSQVPGYTTGGTIHVVLNNQVGFTTSAEEGRSTRYCTDIAKMVDAPIFHVNGDDPEACVFAMKLLYDYRYEFKEDVVIDLVCYRRHGHQEVDEPSMTQPLMYKVIKKHLTPNKLYAQKLEKLGVIQPGDLTKIEKNYRKALDSGQSVVDLDETTKRNAKHKFSVDWKSYNISDWRHPTKTSLSKKDIQSIAAKCLDSLEKVMLQPQVAKIVANRRKMAAGEIPLDWGFAETLAYASLLLEGYPVRISGEDVQRGTFGHRHAVLHDFEDGSSYVPLRNLSEKQANIWIYNSILSEEGVMGFEVGYAAAAPDTLVIWEAQFGDFANGAQVLVDQFLSSGEQKWGQKSGLALFLPHGYEGQGPEHSSARLERYLQLCAQHNMQVCVPTTPAQVFHMLRRQMIRKMRIPLIVMTPKSMLRAPLAVSTIEDFSQSEFQPLIGEIDNEIKPKKVRRVLLCCGKVYYDLLMQRRENKQTDVAIIRIEQLYPFPQEELAKMLLQYPAATEVIWVQEEPRNQGAWYSMQHHMRGSVSDKQKLTCISREASAAPAGGYMSTHMERQRRVVADALASNSST